jgi:hypothetical protein
MHLSTETQFKYLGKAEQLPLNSVMRRQIGAALVQWGGFAPTHVLTSQGESQSAPPTALQQALAQWRRPLGDDAYEAAISARDAAVDSGARARAEREQRAAEKAESRSDTRQASQQARAALRSAMTQPGPAETEDLNASAPANTAQDAQVPAVVLNEEELASWRRRQVAEVAAERERKALADAWANFSFPTASNTTRPSAPAARAPAPAVRPAAKPVSSSSLEERARQAVLAMREKKPGVALSASSSPTQARSNAATTQNHIPAQAKPAQSASSKQASALRKPGAAQPSSVKEPEAKSPKVPPVEGKPSGDGLFSKITGIFRR